MAHVEIANYTNMKIAIQGQISTKNQKETRFRVLRSPKHFYADGSQKQAMTLCVRLYILGLFCPCI